MTVANVDNPTSRTLLSVRQLCEKYEPTMNEGTIRWWLTMRDKNGLAPATLKIGKRVFIDEQKFVDWLYSHVDQRTAKGKK